MPQLDGILEQVLVTSDGMLTRATDNVPFNVRARRIVVTAHTSINQSIEISVIVGTTGKLVWRSDTPAMEKTPDGTAWEGGVWTFTDTSTWYTIGFVAGQEENKAVLVEVARTAVDASVEQLRTLLNRWLRIRPGVTMDVCEIVKMAMQGKFTGAQAWKAVKAAMVDKEEV